jgi:FkbM family methyltransferase
MNEIVLARFWRPFRRAARQIFQLPPSDAAEEIWRLRALMRAPVKTPGSVPWRGRPLHYVDGAAVFGQLHEIFQAGVYDFATPEKTPRIIDCGAHVGVGVIRWRELFPAADITAIEADPEIVVRLRKNLSVRADAKTEVISAAAWIENGEISFCRTSADNGHIDPNARDKIPARDLAELCRSRVDFLKLDIEGAEQAVMEHLHKRGVLPNVRRLACEWHQWTEEAPALHRALEQLVNAGFIYRISGAQCLGASTSPAFPRLPWPANHLIIHAWRRE